MKRSIALSCFVLGLGWFAPPAEANLKLNLCMQGIRLSCNTAINQKKFKTAKEKALWLNNCVNLGLHQCKVRLGMKKPVPRKAARRAPRRTNRTVTRTRTTRTVRNQPSKAHCKSTCLAQARARMKTKVLKSRSAARVWMGVCFKRCRAGSVASTNTRTSVRTRTGTRARNHVHVRHTRPAARGVHAPRGQCRQVCTKQARVKLSNKTIGSRSAARVWVSQCVTRCRRGGAVAPAARTAVRNVRKGVRSSGTVAGTVRKGRSYCAKSCRAKAKLHFKAGKFKTRAAARAWVGVCFKKCMR